MKKLILLFAVTVLTGSLYACRETTEERNEDTMESYDDAGTPLEEDVQTTDDF